MKRTDPNVEIVHELYGSATVPQSAYDRVWSARGYRLSSEVEAEVELEEEPEAEAETPPPAASRGARSPQVGETPTGDSD